MDMCTALTLKTKDFYFGRTLDIERSYHELVTVTPRNFPFRFREEPTNETHYALIGMAAVFDNQPLYYDAVNEKGLAMAGLNFPYNAYYSKNVSDKKRNIAPFEFISQGGIHFCFHQFLEDVFETVPEKGIDIRDTGDVVF